MAVQKNAFLLFWFILLFSNSVSASGLRNAGFENGLQDWVLNSQGDMIIDTGTEGASDSGTYADLGIVVNPYIGAQMLRLGSPKQVNESQNRGVSSVTQKFTSFQDNLVFSFRVFSWEHRGDDIFRFDIRDGNGNSFPLSTPVTITFPRGPAQTCAATPCELIIDVGKRGDFLDSGWTEVKVTDLPTDGSDLTVEYSIIGGQNEAHATWVYFDNANTPPVAKFSFTSDTITEGDFVTFNDESYDPDPGDKIVSWVWNVDGPGFDNTVNIESKNSSFLFANDDNAGAYAVSLTVTDTYGAFTTVSTGGLTLDQVLISTISVQNWAPVVSVLNQEVLAGSEINLIGRFIDPGFLDTHSALWTVDGSGFSGTVNEQNIPFVSTGVATGLGAAPTTLGMRTGNSLQITDDLGAYSGADFVLNILDADYSDPREGDNDGFGTAPIFESGWVYLSALENLGDIDIFEIQLSTSTGPEPLPAGSEVLVKLTDLPLDADLILLSKLPEALESTGWGRFGWGRFGWGRFGWGRFGWGRFPFSNTGWGRFPYSEAGWGRFPYVDAGWGRFPYSTAGWGRFPYSNAGWGRFPWSDTSWVNSSANSPVESFPLSEMAYLLSSNSGDIGSGDIDLSELGLDAADLAGMTVIGYSANRGLEDEELLIRTDFPGTQIYAVVVANNGMASSEPFSVQVEASIPVPLEALVGGACNGMPVVSGADVITQATSLYSHGGGIKMLIVTQAERMSLLNNMDDAAKAEFTDSLIELADNPAVMGEVISLPSNIFDGWDANHCSIDLVNNVSSSIREILVDRLKEAQYSGVKYILFVGDDNIIPHRRVPDETVISNERLYVPESFLEPGSSLYTSTWKGYNLTDDYYTDDVPEPFQGRAMYVPDIATARLVETPNEIMSLIQSFIASDGFLPTNSALVSGYDFFTDGSNLTKSYLGNLTNVEGGSAVVTSMVNETWTAADLRCNFLGLGAGCEAHDVNSINAHFNHFAGLSAFGFNTDNYGDILTSADVANAGNGIPVLQNSLSYTIGCHAGLNVPNGSAYPADLFGGEFDPNLDFPQAMAQQKSVFIASTGYGLGDDEGMAGTELLMAILSEQLLAGGEVGTALLTAKKLFVNGVSNMDVYSEKSSIQTTLYGLPMWKMAPSAAQMNPPVSPYNSTPVANFRLTVDDGGEITTTHAVERVDVDHLPGSSNSRAFYTASGDHQVTAWRPIQPKVVVDVTDTDNLIHGVLVTGGDYSYLGDMDSFYPVISKPRQEWAREDDENPTCVNAFWPSTLASINTFDGANEFAQSLIVLPGQFRCASGDVADIFGTQRVFNSLNVQILRSVPGYDEFTEPTISEIDFRNNEDGSLTVNVDAIDDSGISKIVLLLVKDGVITSSAYENLIADAGSYSLEIPNFVSDTRVIIQVVDLAGNVSTWSGKGVNVRIIEVDAGDSILYSSLSPTTLKGTIPFFADVLTKSPSMFYRWEFGDGTYAFGRLAKDGLPEDIVTVANDGSATFTVDHQYTINYNTTAELKVTDAFGGVGIDEVNLIVCGDAADLAGFDPGLDYTMCGINNSSPTAVSIYLTVDGDDISNSAQYRVHLDIKTKPGNPIPDGKEDIMIKYAGGSYTGLKSLYVEQVNYNTLRFDFDLSEVKWKGSYFDWFAETQDGVAGAPNAGFIDVMPDVGMFRYVIQ